MDFYIYSLSSNTEFSNKLITLHFALNVIKKKTIINTFNSDNSKTAKIKTQHHRVTWQPIQI